MTQELLVETQDHKIPVLCFTLIERVLCKIIHVKLELHQPRYHLLKVNKSKILSVYETM